jgi:dipeptidase E
MKLLLTSAGLKNSTIKQAFADLVGKPYAELNVAYALTASIAEAGDHSWAMNDMNECLVWAGSRLT